MLVIYEFFKFCFQKLLFKGNSIATYHQFVIINIHFYILNYCIGNFDYFEIKNFISMSIPCLRKGY